MPKHYELIIKDLIDWLALETVAEMGIAPTVMLFSDPNDSLAAAGVILADGWVG